MLPVYTDGFSPGPYSEVNPTATIASQIALRQHSQLYSSAGHMGGWGAEPPE